MSDEAQPPVAEDLTWLAILEVRPTQDGRFFTAKIEIRQSLNRVPVHMNSAGSTDLLYEKLQAEVNNALRQIVNSIQRDVVQPNKPKRR